MVSQEPSPTCCSDYLAYQSMMDPTLFKHFYSETDLECFAGTSCQSILHQHQMEFVSYWHQSTWNVSGNKQKTYSVIDSTAPSSSSFSPPEFSQVLLNNPAVPSPATSYRSNPTKTFTLGSSFHQEDCKTIPADFRFFGNNPKQAFNNSNNSCE